MIYAEEDTKRFSIVTSIVTHRETGFDRLSVLYWNSPIGLLYALLFKKDALYSSFNSGAKLRINSTEDGIPILYESEDGTGYYMTHDNIKLEVSIEFLPIKGNVGKFYLQYCDQSDAV